MKEFIDKLIKELADSKEHEHNVGVNEFMENGRTLDAEFFRGKELAYKDAISIVNQLAEEYYANSPQKSADGWIPCSERLPEEIIKDCLVTLENGAVFQASYSQIGEEFRMICWHGIERFSEENRVIAWMPLP